MDANIGFDGLLDTGRVKVIIGEPSPDKLEQVFNVSISLEPEKVYF